MDLSGDSRCSRILLMSFAVESAHFDYERNVYRDWIGRAIGRKQTKGGLTIYGQRWSIVPMCYAQTHKLVRREKCIVDEFPHMCPNTPSHVKENVR